ncbi:hypothetical protein B0A48_11250 [Cryoendolithus antarcticus]|uniref:MutL C-terminal dimerisation domain-containing protein n=1 Tax=Cryoendolithus antarcticus TaxID=1507870 RepID=A0A1V8SUV7_9PEZI|nr:hypothetical protein B0A48_11250 [Cryoendolithus antarcticus]
MSTHGTEVVVKDIFGNMPVRLKQRALSHDVGRTHDLKIRASIKHSLVALLVAWKRPCIIKLYGAEEASSTVTLSTSHHTTSAVLTEKSLNRLDGIGARFDMRDALSVVFQAGLAEHSTRTKWVPVSASTLRITVRGMICTEPAASKTCQFVSMGPRPCNAAGAESELYECINKIFENSSFGIVEDEQVIPDEAELLRRRRDRRFKMDGHTLKSTRGTKGVDRWPMFVLQIRRSEADPGSLQSTASSERELRLILDVLDAMVRQWLTAQGCRPRKKRRRADDPRKNHSVQQQGIRDRSLLNVDTRDDVWPESDTSMSVRPSTADTLSRIKAGRRSLLDVWESRKPRTAPEGQIGSTTKYARHADGLVSRRLASLQIPVTLVRLPGDDTGGIHYAHSYHDVQTALAPEADGASTITKSALRSAIVVRQVDRKYILASLTCRDDTTRDATKALVIIDQHAASERVMLEALLADLCTPADPEVSALPSHSASACRPGVACTALAPPIVFELSTRELELFTLHEQHFARWGIIFDLHHQMEILGTSQVRQAQVQPTLRVLALPPVIIERCKLFPKLLVELLHGEIWTLADRFQWPRSARAEDPADESTVAEGKNHQWLRKIGSCPKGLIDLLNSRACRSAIMFNDVLSVPECQELLDKLGRCAFPFMCAHGRVSMAPLVDTKDVAALMAGSGIGQSALPRTAAAKAESPFVQTYTQWTRLSLNNENG